MNISDCMQRIGLTWEEVHWLTGGKYTTASKGEYIPDNQALAKATIQEFLEDIESSVENQWKSWRKGAKLPAASAVKETIYGHSVPTKGKTFSIKKVTNEEMIQAHNEWVKLMEKWPKMSRIEKMKASPIHYRKERMMEVRNNSMKEALRKLTMELAIVKDEDGIYKMDGENLSKLKNILMREASSRDVDRETLDAINNIDTMHGLDPVSFNSTIESTILKIADKRTVSRRKKGFGAVLTPAFMAKKIKRFSTSYTDPETGKVYAATMDDYRINDSNNTVLAMGIYLPDYLRKHVNASGILNVDEITNPRILEGIGYRIPTQDLASIEFIYVKGFLPPLAGDMAIVPEAIVPKTNADFDWDKLFVHLPNVRKNPETGKVEYIEYLEDEDRIWDYRKKEFAMDYEPVKYQEILEDYHREVAEELFGRELDLITWMDVLPDIMNYLDPTMKLRDIFNELDEEIMYLHNISDKKSRQELIAVKKDLKSKLAASRARLEKIREKKEQRLEDEIYSRLRVEVFDKLESLDEKNGLEALDNLYLELEKQVISRGGKFGKFIAPVTVESGKSPLRDEIDAMFERAEAKRKEEGRMKAGITDNGLKNTINLVTSSKSGGNLIQATLGVGSIANTIIEGVQSKMVDGKARTVLTGLPHHVDWTQGRSVYGNMLTKKVKGVQQYYTSDLQNENASGFLDAGGDPFMAKANIVGNSGRVSAKMNEIGVPQAFSVNYLNQPSILFYNAIYNLQNSHHWRSGKLIHEIDINNTLTPKGLLMQLKRKAGIFTKKDETGLPPMNEQMKYWQQNMGQLMENADPYFDGNNSEDVNYFWAKVNSSKEFARMQYYALADYIQFQENIQLEEIARDARNIASKKLGKRAIIARYRQRKAEKMMTDPNHGHVYSKYMAEDSINHSFYKGLSEVNSMLEPLSFILSDRNARYAVDDFLDEVVSRYDLTEVQKEELIETFANEIWTAIFQMGMQYKTGKTLTELMDVIVSAPETEEARIQEELTKNQPLEDRFMTMTIPKFFKALQDDMRKPGTTRKKNPLLEHMAVNLNIPHVTENYYGATLYNTPEQLEDLRQQRLEGVDKRYAYSMATDHMYVRNRSGNNMDIALKDELKQGWRDLVEEFGPEFEERLFTFVMMQSGISESNNNLMDIIPPEVYKKYMSELTMHMEGSGVDLINGFARSTFYLNQTGTPAWSIRDIEQSRVKKVAEPYARIIRFKDEEGNIQRWFVLGRDNNSPVFREEKLLKLEAYEKKGSVFRYPVDSAFVQPDMTKAELMEKKKKASEFWESKYKQERDSRRQIAAAAEEARRLEEENKCPE